ncbi:MAG TPA: RsmE family RNA methyltransferase [Candidatus Latescibacteria bacterium]|nr:RsmE family RNA methyltransferase [Candidatus Latescibacterota bacterium]HJP30514.1 RsmE family RNA methyltransferase [Candidatus Latescibacterota bacterium]
MNIILFQAQEISRPLLREDPRARHILDVLRRKPGESFDVGLIDGPRGKAVVDTVTDAELILSFTWETELPAPERIALIAGLCRPQTNRRVLREAAALGVARMLFPRTERGEPTYADSSLWSSGEYERQVLTGVEQAFATSLPDVDFGMDLGQAITAAGGQVRIALDNYEGIKPLPQVVPGHQGSMVLAAGSERGWAPAERDLLRSEGYQLAGMGPRVLRTETAVIGALAVIKSVSGAWDAGSTPDTRQDT